ncbi:MULTISPECIES: tyrosine-type recombinase/integrase [Vibrio]|uniref:tyrosine-type recombinase/integrase n=1 Tax=Vibrio TaxID=662 RepID=UPI0008422AEC|nr:MULTISPECIES: tyrosine-type recombinase/integrase [Vibrio]ODM56967.1 hypothetical protein BC455_17905 [Vibrio harveyi]USD58690.1 tyrosine-type recombinase/integrase [Vibrio sp. SCSIO 43155]
MTTLRKSQRSELLLEDNNIEQRLARHKVDFIALDGSIDPEECDVDLWLENYKQFLVDRHALKVTTVRMLASTLKMWDAYCESKGLYSFPIQPKTLRRWFELKKKQQYRRSTLLAYKAHLSYFHQKVFLVEDPTKSTVVMSYFRSVINDLAETDGQTEKERQALPFRRHHLTQFIATVQDDPTYRNMRDLTLLTVLYGTMLRFDEVRNIRLRQLVTRRSGELEVIEIQRLTSKTTDSPAPKVLTGDFATIVKIFIENYCADYSPDDYLFRSTYGVRKTNRPINESTVNRVFKRAWNALAPSDITPQPYTLKSWSCHSCRVGGAVDAYENEGLSEEQIAPLGDWTIETLRRYLRNSSVRAASSTIVQKGTLL